MGSMFRELCRWEVGGMSGMVTEDSETFRLDNLESEVVAGACGVPDRFIIYLSFVIERTMSHGTRCDVTEHMN